MAYPGQPPDQNQPTQSGQSYDQFQLDSQGKRQQGTGFTNINKILQAGQGAGQQMGQVIGQGIGQQAGQFQNQLGQSENEFKAGKDTNTYGGDTDTAKVQQGISSALNQGQTSNADDFKKYLSGQYSGPQNLTNTQQLQNQAQNVQNLGQATQSNYGRQGLLQQMVGKGQYTGGQQTLDNLLLGQTGQQPLQAARQQTTGLGQQLNQAQQQAQNQAKQSALQNQSFANQTLGALGGAAQDVGSAVSTNQAQQQSANESAKNSALQLQALLNKGAGIGQVDRMGHPDTTTSMSPENFIAANKQMFTPDVLAKLGLSGNELAGNINLGALAQEVQPGDTTVTQGQALNPDQARQLQALQQLAQSGNKDILGRTGINQGDISAATAPGYTQATYNPYKTASDLTALQTGTATGEQNSLSQQLQNNQTVVNTEQQRLASSGLNQDDIQKAINDYKSTGSFMNSPDPIRNPNSTRDADVQSSIVNLINTQNKIPALQQQLAQPKFQTIQQLLASQGSPVSTRI